MTTDRKRRPRRIAADEAHAWARNLRLNNSQAKLTLSMLTLYVNGDGYCFVSIPTLADDTELSTQTVRRRLAWLEDIGAIARVAQWLDDKGVRNGEGRGKRTSDLIRLNLHADDEAIEERAAGSQDGETGASTPIHGEGPPEAEIPVSPTAALPQPYHCGKGLTSEPETESSPQPPSGGSVSAEGWDDFQKDWQEPILRQSIAQDEWSRLSPEQRLLARQAARGYVIWRKEHKKPPNVISAHLFLRERDAWQGFAAKAPDAPRAASGGYPVDSPEGKALRALYNIARTPLRELHGRVSYSGEVTPQLLALADEGRISASMWIEETNKIARWSQFLAKHVKGVRPQIVTTRGIGANQRRGIYVPGPWPPRKDGTWSDAPDEPVTTNEDLDALASEGQR